MLIKPKYIAILDVGSSSVIAFASERNNDGLLSIKATSEQAYEGYQKSEWLSKESMSTAVTKAMQDVIAKTSPKIKTIYVGVPGEFIKVVTKNVIQTYSQERRINDEDINQLYSQGDTFQQDFDWQLINSSAIYYTVDENKRLIDPRGAVVIKKIDLLASYVLCSAKFVEDIQSVIGDMAEEIKFVSSDWAQAISLIEPEKRDQGVLLCDVGYISTSVLLVRGDGILDHKAISNGGGFIESDLAFCLDLPFKTCIDLKKMIDLNLSCDDDDELAIKDKKGNYIKSQYVNDIINARIEDICENINKAIDKFTHKCPAYLKIYLTGGGITDVRGASKIFSERINRAVEIISPSLPNFNKPRYTSSVGIMEVVARWEQNKISFIKKIFANK